MSDPSNQPEPSGQSRPTLDLPPHSAEGATTQAFKPKLWPHEQQIGPYHLLETIGEGGMGVVYKAEQRHPIRRLVALKLTKFELDSRQVIARFESERQALAMMNHPNIARVLDAGTTPTGRPYFVMEYVPGESITRFCDREHYTLGQRLELFKQACEAVQHAHQKAIIHRDLKPGNILVSIQDNKPVVKVIDFGLAKATAQQLTDRTLHTEAGQLLGTREYMSPEQADPGALDVDTRTDIYSLGVILYELLIGALPFDDLRTANYAEIQRIICEVDPPRPSTRLGSLGPAATEIAKNRQLELALLGKQLKSELEWIPLKAMRKERWRRYSTVAELSQDIDNYLAHRPLIAAPESRIYRLRKMVRRNKGAVIAATLILLALLAGIVGTSIGLIGQARQRALAEKEAENARVEAARQRAVSSFLGNMLSAADPDRSLGDKVTVLKASEEALKRLDQGELKDQPLIEAMIRGTIGRTLVSLARFDEAAPVLQKALDLSRSSLPAGHLALTLSLNDLAALRVRQGNLREAEALYRESLELARKNLSRDDPALVPSLNDLAIALQEQDRLAEAEALLREALDLLRGAKSKDERLIAVCAGNLARLLYLQSKLEDAERLYSEALEIYRKAQPPRPLDVANVLDNLGAMRHAQGKMHDAEKLAREALDLRRQALPDGHVDIAMTLANLALLVKYEGNYADAEKMHMEALEIRRKRLPPNHPDIALSLLNLGALYDEQGINPRAEALYREALDAFRSSLPPEHPLVAQAMNNLASVLMYQGKLEEADPLMQESLRIRRKVLPSEHPDLTKSTLGMGRLLRAQGKLEEAEPFLVETVEMRRKVLPAGHIQIGNALLQLGLLRQAQGRFAEAEALHREAVAIRSASFGAKSKWTAEAAGFQADALDALKRPDDASAVRRQYDLSPATAASAPTSAE
jgi:serine/threonine protein kinase